MIERHSRKNTGTKVLLELDGQVERDVLTAMRSKGWPPNKSDTF